MQGGVPDCQLKTFSVLLISQKAMLTFWNTPLTATQLTLNNIGNITAFYSERKDLP
jgi:hypothetical protein